MLKPAQKVMHQVFSLPFKQCFGDQCYFRVCHFSTTFPQGGQCLHLFVTVTLISFTGLCVPWIIAALFFVILDPKKAGATVRVLRLNPTVSVRAASQGCRTKEKGDTA